jgi:hypothetical protein
MSGGSHGRLKSFKWLALRCNMSVLDNLSDGKDMKQAMTRSFLMQRISFVNLYRSVYL